MLTLFSKDQWTLAILSVLFLIYGIYMLLDYNREKKLEKLTNSDELVVTVKKKKQKKRLFGGDPEKLRMTFVRAGYPLKFIDEYNYKTFKIIMAIISAVSTINIENGQFTNSWLKTFLYWLMGYFILDVYMRMKVKKQKKTIKEIMLKFITLTIDGLKSGMTPQSIISIALKKMPIDNPLYAELKLLNKDLRSRNFEKSLEAFRERLDMEEIDNYCYSLLQYEIGGRSITMLKYQQKLLTTIAENKRKRETQTTSNYSSIATVLMVVALLLIIIGPIMAMVKNNSAFN